MEQNRRAVLKKALYVTPAVVTTLAVMPAFAAKGSNNGNHTGQSKKPLIPMPPVQRKAD